MAKDLIIIGIVHHSADLFRRSIRLDNLILTLHPLLILGPVLLLDLLVILDCLDKLGLDKGRLHHSRENGCQRKVIPSRNAPVAYGSAHLDRKQVELREP